MLSLAFDSPEIAQHLDAMSPDELHALSFGVIHLDAFGTVDFYSDTESRQSGCPTPQAMGHDFYNVVAPCMANPTVHGVFAAAAERHVDTEIGHTGDFNDRQRFLRIRITSSGKGGVWQLHARS